MSGSPYPAIPLPTQDIASMYNAMLLMRQCLTLLTNNIQAITGQQVTLGSQVFTTQKEHSSLSQTVAGTTVTLSSLSASLTALQNEVTRLKYTLQSEYLPLTGGTLTGDLTIDTTAGLLFYTQTSDGTTHTLNPVVSP